MLTDNYIFISFLFGIIIYFILKVFTKKSVPHGLNALQGPVGWPLFGNLFSINKPLCCILYDEGKKYGPVFKYTMGCRDIVIFNKSKILYKTLKEQGNNFSGRFLNALIKFRIKNSGILFTEKEWWATQRSFALKVLRDFGLGKQRSNEIIDQECAILLKDIEERCGKVISGRYLFPKATVNVIAKLVMNMRFERDSKGLQELTSVIETTTQNSNFLITLFQMYPILDKFPKISPLIWLLSGRNKMSEAVHKFIKNIIDDHRKRFHIENEGEDFIDIFLKEQYRLEQGNVKDHTFTDFQLQRTVIELFIAGYETTSTTLSWSMIIMAKYQDIQDRIYNEINNLLGADKIPNINDKKSLHYTQAVMDEILRYSSVVPMSVSHRVFENAEIEGFFIPENSIIFPNLYACHRDEDVWEKPFEFYPEHFLTTSDNGDFKYKPREELIPFGIGKRQCLGEGLARVEYFTFLTGILQRFKVKFEKEMTEDDFAKLTSGTNGGIRAPLNSNVVFEMRL